MRIMDYGLRITDQDLDQNFKKTTPAAMRSGWGMVRGVELGHFELDDVWDFLEDGDQGVQTQD